MTVAAPHTPDPVTHAGEVAATRRRRQRTGAGHGASPIDRTAPPIDRQRSSDVLRFCALRVIEDVGPVAGLGALNLLAPMARLLGENPPVFPLLHELADEHLLVATPASPPRYAVTRRGRLEASRLRAAVRARLAERLGPRFRLEMLLSAAG